VTTSPPQAALDRLALFLAACQPTYPLYVWWLAGGDWWLSGLTSLSAIPFALVPRLARRAPNAGRLAVPVVGAANTLLGVGLFGRASGIWWLLVPSALILALSGTRHAARWALAMLAIGAAAILLMPGPVGSFPAAGLAALWRVNAISAAILCVAIPLMLRKKR